MWYLRREPRASRHLATGLATLGLAVALAQAPNAHADSTRPARVTVYGAQVAATMPVESALARQIGRPDNLDELVRRLLVAVRGLSPYQSDLPMPAVHVLPLAEIHQHLCGGACTIRAAYVPGEGLYMDEAMRPLNNPYDQSILFHELVHHAQVVAAGDAAHDDCQHWREREIEAYSLQNRFLYALGSPSRVVDPGVACASPDGGSVQTFDAR